MADQKLTDRSSLETSSASSLIHVVDNGTSYNQTKANFLKDVKGYAGDIDVSAIWTSGLSFDVTADSYIVNNTQYSSTSGTVTLDTADATLDRIDLIVAVAPVSPATVGTVGKISGTPASPTVVVPPDYASDSVYVIKQVLVKAAQTEPFGTSKTVVFDEGSEWTVTYPTGFSLVSSGAYNGTNCIFGDNVSVNEKITFTSGSPYTYNDVDLITFYIKSTNPSYWNGTNNLSIRFLNSGTLFKSVSYNDQNGIYNEWNKVSISKDLLGLKDGTFNQIQIVPSVGLTYSFLLDIIEIHQGSGSDPNNLISQWYNDVGYITEGFDEFIESTGTRAGGDLLTTIGDYDGSFNGTTIVINDATGYVGTEASFNVQDLIINSGGVYTGSLLSNNVTANRNIELPDESGTIALTSDIDTFEKLDAIVADKSLVNLEDVNIFTSVNRFPALIIGTDLAPLDYVSISDIKIEFFDATNNKSTTINPLSNPTVNINLTLPDESGTIALTSDLGDYVDLTSTQAITGTKIFTSPRVSSDGKLVMLHRTGTSSSADAINLNANNENFVIINNDAGTKKTLTLNLGDITGGSVVTLTAPDANGKIPSIKATVPSSATDTGVVGQIAYDSSYFYVCTATNTWVRTALATW